MATLISIGFIVLGVVFACTGLTGPVCPIHGDEGVAFMTAGLLCTATGIGIAFISIVLGKKEKTIEIEISEETEQEEQIEKKDHKYFYKMLMEDDETYEECVKNWKNRVITHILIDGNMFQIPETVIEDVISEREIIFPKRIGES